LKRRPVELSRADYPAVGFMWRGIEDAREQVGAEADAPSINGALTADALEPRSTDRGFVVS
jgi:hypothetical protein